MNFDCKTVYILEYTHASLVTSIEGVYTKRESAQNQIDCRVKLGDIRHRYSIIEKELIGE